MTHQPTIDDKAAYQTPALMVFGALTALTLSGNGTMVELRSSGMDCVGGTALMQMMKYPCA
jgi:hypothetical protein